LCDYALTVEIPDRVKTFAYSSQIRTGERIARDESGKLVSIVTKEYEIRHVSLLAKEIHGRFKEYYEQRWPKERTLDAPGDAADMTWHSCLTEKRSVPNEERLTQILRKVIQPEKPVATKVQTWGDVDQAGVDTEVALESVFRQAPAGEWWREAMRDSYLKRLVRTASRKILPWRGGRLRPLTAAEEARCLVAQAKHGAYEPPQSPNVLPPDSRRAAHSALGLSGVTSAAEMAATDRIYKQQGKSTT
jgi:hypothetical protein